MEGLDKTSVRLPSFSVEKWRGFIFVNLDGSAQPLHTVLRELDMYVNSYEPEAQRLQHVEEETWATNWKCLVENFMEGYHLTPTHSKTLHPFTPTALCEKLPGGPGFTLYRSHLDPSCGDLSPYQPHLSAVERRSIVLCCIYPSFLAGFGPGRAMSMYMCLRPVTADSVGIRWGLLGVLHDSQPVSELVKLTKEFCAEDRATLEGLQRGLKTRYYHHGPLANQNLEGTIWDILQYMASRLGAVTRKADSEAVTTGRATTA
jgi:phenylpropionate dioxygenase-like ring-hydroxylating dioxygenase large terminal subunit